MSKPNKQIIKEMLERDGFTENEIKLASLDSLTDDYLREMVLNESDDYGTFRGELEAEIHYLVSNHMESIQQRY